jgi:hypothetical protein
LLNETAEAFGGPCRNGGHRAMTSTRESPDTPPHRARGVAITNACLLFAAALGVLPWVFAPVSLHTNASVTQRGVTAETPLAATGAVGVLSPRPGTAQAGAHLETFAAAGITAVRLAVYTP